MLLFRAQPKMTMIQKKLCAVLFRRNGIVVRVLQDFDAIKIYLDAAGARRVLTDPARLQSARTPDPGPSMLPKLRAGLSSSRQPLAQYRWPSRTCGNINLPLERRL